MCMLSTLSTVSMLSKHSAGAAACLLLQGRPEGSSRRKWHVAGGYSGLTQRPAASALLKSLHKACTPPCRCGGDPAGCSEGPGWRRQVGKQGGGGEALSSHFVAV